jgi:hypothetical protein
LVFQGDPPPDAPQVLWVSDATTADHIAARVPGAVGFVDLDKGTAEVQPDTLSPDELAELLGPLPGRHC